MREHPPKFRESRREQEWIFRLGDLVRKAYDPVSLSFGKRFCCYQIDAVIMIEAYGRCKPRERIHSSKQTECNKYNQPACYTPTATSNV